MFTQKELISSEEMGWTPQNYDMNILYHWSKANVVADTHNRLSMGSVALVVEVKKELSKDVHQLAFLGVCLIDMLYGGVIV